MIEIPAWLFWLLVGAFCLDVLTPRTDQTAAARKWGDIANAMFWLPLLFIFTRGWP